MGDDARNAEAATLLTVAQAARHAGVSRAWGNGYGRCGKRRG
jgi:hypothetical protein